MNPPGPVFPPGPDGPLTPPPELEPPPGSREPPTLVADYALLREDGLLDFESVVYRPRQFATSPFRGWDLLELPGGSYRTYTGREWLRLTLNRPAAVVVIWQGSRPPVWLDGWAEGPEVGGEPTFLARFEAGEVVLGAIGGTANQPYTVLLAEADGRPSAAPPVPDGLEEPTPNERCPDWVHDRYLVEADDGRLYRTWHPVIDPAYWCYFGHEHGSDPALLPSGYRAAYGYTAYYNDLQNEPHNGFKGFSFEDGGLHWFMSVHFTSGLSGRVCARFHTVEIRAEEPDGALAVWFRYKADFGETRAGGYPDPEFPNRSLPVTTAACDNAGIAALDTFAQKKLRARENKGYETWRLDTTFSGTLFGMNPAGLTFDTLNPVLKCADLACEPDEMQPTGSNGSDRAVDFLDGFGFSWSAIPPAVRTAIKAGNGYFYTDQYGSELRSAQDPTLQDPEGRNAVLQFVRPGLAVELAGPPVGENCHPLEPWRGRGACGDERNGVSFTLESAIEGVN